MERTHKVLQGFFWFAFAAFLSASIPHVAYFFRAYEPASDLPSWWVVSYAIAASIDITIFLLSVTVANMHRQHKAKSLIASVWVFIIGLAALSWFINYKYAEHFLNTGMVSATSVTLPWIGTIPDINPIIASMFQALAIAYTWIADKIAAGEQVKSAVDLKKEREELELALAEKQRIAALKRGGKVNTLTGLFDAGKAIVNHVRTPGDMQAESETITDPGASEYATLNASDTQQVPQERNTDKLSRITEPGASVKDEQNAGLNESKTEHSASEYDSSLQDTSQKSVSIKEAALLLNVSETHVRTLVNKGKLRTSPRNKKLVLKSSIDAYNTARKETGKIPIIVTAKEQVNTAHNGTVTLGFVEQKMYDALMSKPDEITELLHLAQEQSIEDFTATLKERYREYASYITPERVSNVLAYSRLHHTELVELTA